MFIKGISRHNYKAGRRYSLTHRLARIGLISLLHVYLVDTRSPSSLDTYHFSFRIQSGQSKCGENNCKKEPVQQDLFPGKFQMNSVSYKFIGAGYTCHQKTLLSLTKFSLPSGTSYSGQACISFTKKFADKIPQPLGF